MFTNKVNQLIVKGGLRKEKLEMRGALFKFYKELIGQSGRICVS